MARYNEAMNNLMKFNTSVLPRKRSRFDRSHNHATTFDSAYLIPILVDDILPSDYVKLDIDALVKMATPYHPTMDTAYLDLFAFYAPSRLMWDNYTKFFGENLDAEYNELDEFEMPNFQYYATDYTPLMDYMGFPPLPIASTFPSPKVKVERFRMYQRVWNEWFRASEIQSSVPLNLGDNVTEQEKLSVFTLRKAGKLHDYFTSALPYPQAGDSVFLPLGDRAPVITAKPNVSLNNVGNTEPMVVSDGSSPYGVSLQSSSSGGVTVQPVGTFDEIIPQNLFADLKNATSATINQLRIAVTTQQLLELDAMSGLRYTSLLRSHFGVLTADDVLQRTCCLGTHREILGMRTVAQTSSTSGNSALGDLGAYSQTRVANRSLVDQTFTENGVLMVLAVVRPLHTYAQGLDCSYRKLHRFDYFYPVFDGIGNQPIYTTELCMFDENAMMHVSEDSVFGYKPAYEEYRIANNRVSGKMRPQVADSLATWNYADFYRGQPILNDTFISEDESLIDRTIQISNEPQFIGDFYFNIIHERPIGVRGTPGLTRF